MSASKRRFSEAILFLKRVRRIGIRLSIGRRYVCVKNVAFPRLFYTSNECGGLESASPLGGVMFGSKRRLSEALLLLKRVRRIGIRLSIGRRYVWVKTSPFRGSFIPQTGAADRNPPLHWGISVCYGQEEHVLFALLDEDILAVEEHIFGGHGVGRGYLFLVD